MNALDSIVSSAILTTGGTGIIIMIGLFIRQLISNSTRYTAKTGAEVDILTMWKLERDALKTLTEELQKERIELMIKLSNLQQQLQSVQDQLNTLVEDKKNLLEEVKEKEKRCAECIFRANPK